MEGTVAFPKVTCLVMLCAFSFVTQDVWAISASTVNPIMGHEPDYTDSGAEDKLGFVINTTMFNKRTHPTGKIGIPNVNLASINAAVEAFDAKDYLITDVDEDNVDKEGNNTGVLKYEGADLKWFSKETPIDIAALNINACDFDVAKYPDLKLEVTAQYKAVTLAGLPQEGVKAVKRVYEIDPSAECFPGGGKISYAQPVDLEGGKDKLDSGAFEANQGFKLDAGFPTTGFENARFTLALVGNPDPTLYQIESSNPAVASVDTDKVIWLHGKGSVTLTIKQASDGKEMDKYSFTVADWFKLPGLNGNTCAQAGTGTNNCSSNCKSATDSIGAYEVPLAQDLSNAHPSSSALGKNFKREVGNSLMGEWGTLSKYNVRNLPGYKLSNYISDSAQPSGGYFSVSGKDGSIAVALPATPGFNLLCKTK